MGIHDEIVALDLELREVGGLARFLADDGYAARPPEFVFPALQIFCDRVFEVPGCTGQLEKFMAYSRGFDLTNYQPMHALCKRRLERGRADSKSSQGVQRS